MLEKKSLTAPNPAGEAYSALFTTIDKKQSRLKCKKMERKQDEITN